ncbi:RNA-binding region-containing protein 3 [Prorops nasuta]|uniref:RNA-binding region-containing protein 3 n=1 Tax=Prorops nasuta TaxID=863751 RepID=UPI0034CEC2C7
MSEKTICDTLRILHLPPHLCDERRDVLLKKYGAINTKTVRPSKEYTITFAQFSSHQAALETLLHLNQLKVRDKYLSVEFAKKSLSEDISNRETINTVKSETTPETTNKAHFQAFLRKLNGWTVNQLFSQPPPPNIRYKYTPPTKDTLLRIAIQLLKEPIFYTQVLHLMNRMNLPPPFKELEAEFPALKEVYDMEGYKNIFGIDSNLGIQTKHLNIDDEEESEIESEEEENNKLPQVIPAKRTISQSKKRLKIPKFINPNKQIVAPTSTQKVIKPEDLFEAVQRTGEVKNLKIELKTVDKLLDIANSPGEVCEKLQSEATEGGFGLMFPVKTVEESQETENSSQPESKNNFITSKELSDNRITPNDQRILPVFKNYHPGIPSNRLYIKNLAKHVTIDDLHYIYKKYVLPESEKNEIGYDVRLMQEGRMKGQAFVTLQNTKQAQLALNETNGYILKDKPMVVQYAKAIKN